MLTRSSIRLKTASRFSTVEFRQLGNQYEIMAFMNLKSESKKLARSHFELERKRLNWKLVVKNRIKTHLIELILSAKNTGYPFVLFFQENNDVDNLDSIQITAESNYTGITQKLENGESKIDFEKGAGLSFSLSSRGDVVVTIRPYKSEWVTRKEKSIIIKHGISPDNITDDFIEMCIRRFIIYIRASSIYGSYSTRFYEHLFIKYLLIIDIKNRGKLINRSLDIFSRWGLVVISALLGVIFTKFLI